MQRNKNALIALQMRIDSLMKQANDAYAQAARSCGISDSALDILYALRTQGNGLTQKLICDVSFTSKQTVNSAIHKLAAQGIISLEPGTGRTTLVSLTSEGEILAERIIDPMVDAECTALSQFSETEADALVSAFERYTEALASELEKTDWQK